MVLVFDLFFDISEIQHCFPQNRNYRILFHDGQIAFFGFMKSDVIKIQPSFNEQFLYERPKTQRLNSVPLLEGFSHA